MSSKKKSTLGLHELPVLASVSSFWGSANPEEIEAALPAHVPVSIPLDSDDEAYGDDPELSESEESQALAEPVTDAQEKDEAGGAGAEATEVAANQAGEGQAGDGESGNEGEDETQEMDALLEPRAEVKRDDSG